MEKDLIFFNIDFDFIIEEISTNILVVLTLFFVFILISIIYPFHKLVTNLYPLLLIPVLGIPLYFFYQQFIKKLYAALKFFLNSFFHRKLY